MPVGTDAAPAGSRTPIRGPVGVPCCDGLVTVRIDEPVWEAHGRVWAHLVSDESLDELHAFAAAQGIPRKGFHGDHYDVPAEYHARMVEAGAVPTPARELVRRLREAGLRLTPDQRRAARPAATAFDTV
jgi:hypothetical protein